MLHARECSTQRLRENMFRKQNHRLFIALAATAACGNGGSDPTTVERSAPAHLEVVPTFVLVTVGGSTSLDAKVTDDTGASLPSDIVTWRVLNPSVATVSTAGVVRGISEGRTAIRASADTVSVNVPVEVWPHPGIAFVAASGEDLVRAVDLADGTLVEEIPVRGAPGRIVISPDSTLAIVLNKNSDGATLIDIESRAASMSIDLGASPWGVVFEPDGGRALITTTDHVLTMEPDTIFILDIATRQLVGRIPVHDPRGISVTPDGALAYVATVGSNNVSLIDLSADSVVGTIGGVWQPAEIAISPDGALAFITDPIADEVAVHFAGQPRVARTIPVGDRPVDLTVSRDGSFVFVANGTSDELSVIDVRSDFEVSTLPLGDFPRGLATSRGGFRVWVGSVISGDLSLFDPTEGEVLTTIPLSGAGGPLAIAPPPS